MAQGFNQGGPSQESGQSPGFATLSGEGTQRSLALQAEAIKDSNSAFLKAMDQTIKFTDEQFRKSAEEEAKTGVDAAQEDVRKSFFERELQTQAVQAMPESTPKEIQDKEREMARIKAAYDNGSLTSTHYWSRLDATARSLRARYPGYKDEIDATMAKYSGGKPANQVVSDILGSIEAENKKQTKDEWAELWKIGKHVPEIAVADSRGVKLSVPEMRRAISSWEAKESVRKQASAELSYASESWGLKNRMTEQDTKDRTRTVTSVVNLEATDGIDRILAPLAPVLEQLSKAQAEGKSPSPEQLKQISSMVPQLRLKAQAHIDGIFSKKRENGKTMFEMVQDQAEIDRLRKGQMDRVDAVLDAYSKGDAAVLNTLKMYNDLSAQGGEAELRSSDFINRLGAARKLLPEYDVSMAIGIDGVLRREYEAFIDTKLKVATGQNKDVQSATLGGLINSMSRPDVSSATRQRAIDDSLKMMSDQKLSPAVVERFYNFLYGNNKPGDDIMSKLAPGTQREEFFAKMVSPKGLEVIKKLEQAKPGTIEKFKSWVEHNGTIHAQELMNSINRKNDEKGTHLIAYSKEEQTFKVLPNLSFKRDPNVGVLVPRDGDAAVRALAYSANKALASLIPAFQVMYPKKDINQQLFNFLTKANMKLIDTPKE